MIAEPGKVRTGIPGLDDIVGGGLEEKKVYLIAGESGTGKTVFALQFIYEGLRRGENGVYVTVNEKPEDLLEDAKALGWDLEPYVASKHLVILNLVRYVDLGTIKSVRQLVTDLGKHVRGCDAKRLVIDSFDYMVLRAAESEREMVSFVRSMVLAMEENLGCTTILTSPIRTGKADTGIVEMAERAVNGVCILGTDEEKTRRILSIRKMRKNGVRLISFEYRIEPGRGITVKNAPVGKAAWGVSVGEKIPDFVLRAYKEGSNKPVSSSDYRGKWLVMVFYPGDFTFVCPTELAELANNYSRFGALGAEILSVSMDSILSHQTWAAVSPEIQKIPFPMGADPEGTVTQLFGVYTKEGTTRRATFIVDPDGILMAHEIHDDRIGRSTEEILRKVAAAKHVVEHADTACPASWSPGKPDIRMET